MGKELSIYFHWPFCKSKCPYCDFFSQVKRNNNQDEIINGYIEQLIKYKGTLPDRYITSVFFGGGTPSLITPQNISRLIDKINELWNIPSNCEISLEANPNTQTPTLFQDLKNAGINRLSLGVQSFDDNYLKFLGRTHSSQQALSAIEEVIKNFDNHSIDLMYALPDQSKQNWLTQLALASNFGLKHISLYQLMIEENTIFYKKGIKGLDEEKANDLYFLTEDYLNSKRFQKYEVSNYSLPDFQSVHNKAYWLGKDYIGIGKSAHGRLKINNKHYAITNPIIMEELSNEERAAELIIMNLRLTEGINKQNFYIEEDKLIIGTTFISLS
jgi:oxygen-independent coproporphyrinogen-3 oxidase